MELSANLAATGDRESAAIQVRVSHYSRFHRQAVASRGVAAPARELPLDHEVTPHQQVKQHKVYDRPRKKLI